MAAVERYRLPSGRRLTIAMFEDHFGRPLDQQRLLASSVFMQGGHKTVFGLKWDRIDPRISRLLGLPFQTELIAKRVERPLGRVTLDFPGSLFAVELCVIAEHRDTAHQPENRIRFCRCPVLSYLAFRGVA